MKQIIVASKNPVKVKAVQKGFEKMFPGEELHIEMVSVPSGVGDQPMTSEATLQGAEARALNASQTAPTADYWAGVEGGVEETEGGLAAFAWIVIQTRDRIGKARTGTFFLPQRVADLVRQGKELGDADDIVFGRSNSKQDNGAIGILTGNVVDRAKLYEQAVILALIPFKNSDLYESS